MSTLLYTEKLHCKCEYNMFNRDFLDLQKSQWTPGVIAEDMIFCIQCYKNGCTTLQVPITCSQWHSRVLDKTCDARKMLRPCRREDGGSVGIIDPSVGGSEYGGDVAGLIRWLLYLRRCSVVFCIVFVCFSLYPLPSFDLYMTLLSYSHLSGFTLTEV